jgi:hypothetical protein
VVRVDTRKLGGTVLVSSTHMHGLIFHVHMEVGYERIYKDYFRD